MQLDEVLELLVILSEISCAKFACNGFQKYQHKDWIDDPRVSKDRHLRHRCRHIHDNMAFLESNLAAMVSKGSM